MTLRIYVLPMVLVNAPYPTHLPKYLPYSYGGPATGGPFPVTGAPLEPEPTLAGTFRHVVDQGLGDECLLFAEVDPTQNTLLAGKADVDAIPANLDSTIGAGALATTKTRMRSHGIPANWLTASTTWRSVVRGINGIFHIGQALETSGATRLYPVGVTLNTPVDSLDTGYRDSLFAALDTKGYDRSTISGTSTMEDVMEIITAQAGPVVIPGLTV